MFASVCGIYLDSFLFYHRPECYSHVQCQWSEFANKVMEHCAHNVQRRMYEEEEEDDSLNCLPFTG